MTENQPSSKQLSLLSLCRKAGKLKMGFDACEKSLRGTKLLIFSSDISEKTKERMLRKAEEASVATVTIPFKTEDIYFAVGKPTAICSILDKGLAEAFLKCLESSSEETKDLNNRSCEQPKTRRI
ncbi:MAG: hypothetical protein RR315_02105 [Oscillospiraceae bacterium]